MNIRAEHGTKVFVTEKSLKNGYNCDGEKAKKFLKIGETYTVDYTDVDRCNTDVYLIEFPNISFNSVCICDDDDKDDTLMMGKDLITKKKYDISGDDVIKIQDFLKIVNNDFDSLFCYLVSVHQGIVMTNLEAAEYIKDVCGDDYFLRRERLRIEEIERSIKK